MMSELDFVNTKTVASAAGIDPRSVNRAAVDGDLPAAITLAGNRYWKRSQLDELLAALRKRRKRRGLFGKRLSSARTSEQQLVASA